MFYRKIVDELHSWSRKKEKFIPIEVKSGKSGTLRSLHQFMEMTDHSYAIRLYNGPLQIEDLSTPSKKEFKLLFLPYSLTGQIDRYIDWFCNE